MREVLNEWKGGITIGGRKIINLRHANDIGLLTASKKKKDLIELVVKLKEVGIEIMVYK